MGFLDDILGPAKATGSGVGLLDDILGPTDEKTIPEQKQMVGSGLIPFGKIPEQDYAMGRRNWLGEWGDRPAAAIRSAILGKGYTKGAINPTDVPLFQDLALEKYGSKVSDVASKLPEGAVRTAFLNEANKLGFGVSAFGFIADQATNPLTLLTSVVPTHPGVQALSRRFSRNKIGKAMSRAVNTPLFQGKQDPKTAISVIDKEIENVVRSSFLKGVRPSVVGKGTAGRTNKYYEDAADAVRIIVMNKENAGLVDDAGNIVNRNPETLNEFARSIESTKETLFNTYNKIATSAKEQGARFSVDKIVAKVRSAADDLKYDKSTRSYIKSLIDDIAELDGADPVTIQERIKYYNSSLKSFYEGKTGKAQAQVDASVASLLRNELDDLITKSTGEIYKPLRRAYGVLKGIERDVSNRANVAGRAAPKSVFDLTDIFSGGRIVYGILQQNPAEVAAGIAQTGLKNWFKQLNSPDRAIKNMFSRVERLVGKRGQISRGLPPILEAELVTDMPMFGQKQIAFSGTPSKQIVDRSVKQGLLGGVESVPSGKFEGQGFSVSQHPERVPISLQGKIGFRHPKQITNQQRLIEAPKGKMYGEGWIAIERRDPKTGRFIKIPIKEKLAELGEQFLSDLWIGKEY